MQTVARPTTSETSRSLLPTPTLDLARRVIDAALQPIVDAHSGDAFGYEALLRGHDRLGFETPIHLLDHMHLAGALGDLESLVRRCAFRSFKPLTERPRLIFINLDGRLIVDHVRLVDTLLADLKSWNISPTAVCVELSERDDHTRSPQFPHLLQRLHGHGIRVALDDFGTGYSELRMLCDYGIDYIKIDRHFITGVGKSARKRLFLATITDLAHVLGVRVVAEGVETEDEYLSCVEAGCDLVQGYFIAHPSLSAKELLNVYPSVVEARGRLRRAERSDEYLVRSEMQRLPAVRFGCKFEQVFDLFAQDPSQSYFPVVDEVDAPWALSTNET